MKKTSKGKSSADKPAKTQAKPVEVKRTASELPIGKLSPAPWNPRHDITPESVADLTETIRTIGLIERIVVIARAAVDGDGDGYYVIAGNRRLVACREAGLETVPVEIADIDAKRARYWTFYENLQRKDADPVLEAELIGKLLDDGVKMEEIATQSGRSLGWVAKRKSLTSLTEKWRDKARKDPFEVTCLERIARYPAEIQDVVYKMFFSNGKRTLCTDERAWSWGHFSRQFELQSLDLKLAKFSTKECKTCACNSAMQPLLFDDGRTNAGALGYCLKKDCFMCKSKKHVERVLDGLDKKVSVVKVKQEWDIPQYWTAVDKPDQKHPVAYTFTDRDGLARVVFAAKAVRPTVSKAEREEREKKKRCKEARTKFETWAKANMRDVVLGLVGLGGDNGLVDVGRVLALVYGVGMEDWDFSDWLQSQALNMFQGVNVIGIDDLWKRIEEYAVDGCIARRWHEAFPDRVGNALTPEEWEAVNNG